VSREKVMLTNASINVDYMTQSVLELYSGKNFWTLPWYKQPFLLVKYDKTTFMFEFFCFLLWCMSHFYVSLLLSGSYCVTEDLLLLPTKYSWSLVSWIGCYKIIYCFFFLVFSECISSESDCSILTFIFIIVSLRIVRVDMYNIKPCLIESLDCECDSIN
jgi:hypothetical protein